MKRRVLGLLLFLMIIPLFMGCGADLAATGTVTFEIYTQGDNPQTTETEDEYLSNSVEVDFYEGDTLFVLLDENFEITYEDSTYGRYLTAIDTLEVVEANEYVAFYIDGDYAVTGVDDTVLTDGTVYQFRLETF